MSVELDDWSAAHVGGSYSPSWPTGHNLDVPDIEEELDECSGRNLALKKS